MREFVLLCVLFLTRGLAWGQGCDPDELFEHEVLYPVGNGPSSVAVGDLDQDGEQDIAVLNSGSDTVSILMNIGDGAFAPQVQYPSGLSPRDMRLADIDADGDLDIIVCHHLGTIAHILLNAGDATFYTLIPLDVGAFQLDLDLNDFDGDGDVDIVFATPEGLVMFLNAGSAQSFEKLSLMEGIKANEVLSGDIDADGDTDLLARTTSNFDGCNYRVLLCEGVLDYAPPTCEDLGMSSSGTVLLDLDDDLDLDIVFIRYLSDEAVTMKHRYDGDFVNEYAVPRYIGRPNAIVAGDLNLDGIADLAISQSNGVNVAVLLGLGRGFFDLSGYSVDQDTCSVAMGDLDGDGDLDLIIGTDFRDGVNVLINRCDPVICGADVLKDGVLNFFDVSVFLSAYLQNDPIADFTGDGVFNFFDVSAFLVAFNAGCP